MAILEYFGSFDMLQYCVQGRYFDGKGAEVVSVGDFLAILLSADCERVEGIRLSSLALLFERANCVAAQNPSLLSLVETAIQGDSVDRRIEKMIRRFVRGMVIPVGIDFCGGER